MKKIAGFEEAPVVDWAVVREIRHSKSAEGTLFDRLYPIFQEEMEPLLAAFGRACENSDKDLAYESSHQIKGMASAIGATRLRMVANVAMRASIQEAPTLEDGYSTVLAQEFERFQEEIATET